MWHIGVKEHFEYQFLEPLFDIRNSILQDEIMFILYFKISRYYNLNNPISFYWFRAPDLCSG